MKADITELLIFFDELMPSTNEEQKVYWFRTTRKDQITIIFIVSIYEESVDIIIKNSSIDIVGISLKNCSEIRILDQEKKCLEILHPNSEGRCFLSLLSTSILDYNE
jgi:hypothetical protein